MATHQDEYSKPYKNWAFRVGGSNPLTVSLVVWREGEEVPSRLASRRAKLVPAAGYNLDGKWYEDSDKAIQAMMDSIKREFGNHLN